MESWDIAIYSISLPHLSPVTYKSKQVVKPIDLINLWLSVLPIEYQINTGYISGWYDVAAIKNVYIWNDHCVMQDFSGTSGSGDSLSSSIWRNMMMSWVVQTGVNMLTRFGELPLACMLPITHLYYFILWLWLDQGSAQAIFKLLYIIRQFGLQSTLHSCTFLVILYFPWSPVSNLLIYAVYTALTTLLK